MFLPIAMAVFFLSPSHNALANHSVRAVYVIPAGQPTNLLASTPIDSGVNSVNTWFGNLTGRSFSYNSGVVTVSDPVYDANWYQSTDFFVSGGIGQRLADLGYSAAQDTLATVFVFEGVGAIASTGAPAFGLPCSVDPSPCNFGAVFLSARYLRGECVLPGYCGTNPGGAFAHEFTHIFASNPHVSSPPSNILYVDPTCGCIHKGEGSDAFPNATLGDGLPGYEDPSKVINELSILRQSLFFNPHGIVQGFKVKMPGNVNPGKDASGNWIFPAGEGIYIDHSPWAATHENPYFYYNLPVGLHNISVSDPAPWNGWTVEYECGANGKGGCQGQHKGTSVDLNFGPGDVVDLWWHYYPPPVILSGNVKDAATGQGIKGVVINQGVTSPPGCNLGITATDDWGNFSFPNVPIGTSFCLRAPALAGYDAPNRSYECQVAGVLASPNSCDPPNDVGPDNAYNFVYTPVLPPDLVSQSLKVSLSSPRAGDMLTFTGVISNQGAGDASSFSYRFCRDDAVNCKTSTSRVLGGDRIISSLAANTSTIVLMAPAIWTAISGPHTLTLCANVGASPITESNRSNNCTSQSFTVSSSAIDPTLDSDHDGYTDLIERYLGTDPLSACGGSNAWPPNINNAGGSANKVDIFDVNALKSPVFFSTIGDPNFKPRYDLNPAGASKGKIDIFDVNKVGSVFYKICSLNTSLVNGDFESGNLTGWLTSGNANWKVQSTTKYQGTYAAQSGAIDGNQETVLLQTVNLSSSATISFAWTVSSESGYDFLLFCLDNTSTCTRTSGYTDRISGSVAWTTKTYSLTSGQHTLLWKYAKDGTVSSGSDAAWVDNVKVSN